MKSQEIRKELHTYIDEADQATLNFVLEAVVEFKKRVKENQEPLKPMTKEEYFARIERAEENFKNGKVISGKEMSAFIKQLHESI